MEIASSFAATVMPPPYQLGAEEARRDTITREQIPAPKNSQNSAPNQQAADQKGSTSGANSQLAAEAEGFNQARAAQSRPLPKFTLKGSTNHGYQGKGDRGGISSQNAQSEAAQTADRREQALTDALKSLGALGLTPGQNIQQAQAAAAVLPAAAQALDEKEGDNRKDPRESPENSETASQEGAAATSGARFKAVSSNDPQAQIMAKRQAVIARRYNQSFMPSNLGRQLSAVA